MKRLFYYNWQVRSEWFEWCKQFSAEELLEKRTGGMGNILHTLLHIVVVEFDWINDLIGGEEVVIKPEDYTTLEDVVALHLKWHSVVEGFVESWTDDMNDKILILENGKRQFTYEEVMHHVIAHEIHHIGQLSVWARELGATPVGAHYINRGLA
ncbi:DinB family protein [Fredinandcohnia sp. 179-A 10B2 NHS]|uniref:DinB family protein n=1 Tax=Fredinandcohnia sp. 179-A 10B2 NHS TaxID=3235176 RepID=UPI0039A207A9